MGGLISTSGTPSKNAGRLPKDDKKGGETSGGTSAAEGTATPRVTKPELDGVERRLLPQTNLNPSGSTEPLKTISIGVGPDTEWSLPESTPSASIIERHEALSVGVGTEPDCSAVASTQVDDTDFKELFTRPSNIPSKEEIDSAAINLFTDDADDEEVLRILFNTMSSGGEVITSVDLAKISTDASFTSRYMKDAPSWDDWTRLRSNAETKLKRTQGLDFQAFRQCVQESVPTVPGRLHWTGTLNLGAALARCLQAGTIFDGQQGIKEMSEEDIAAACLRFTKNVPSIVLAAWKRLRECQGSSAEQTNSKFAMTEGAYKGRFATLDDFYKGVEYKLGQPNPKLYEGMEKEHCIRSNANSMFVAPNYGLCSKPCWEWAWTVDPEDENTPASLRSRLTQNNDKYPGETGDEFAETIMRFTLRRDADAPLDLEQPNWVPSALAKLDRELKNIAHDQQAGILGSEEEVSRGLTIVKSPCAIESGVSGAIALPCRKDVFLAEKLDKVAQAVCKASGIAGAQVIAEEISERRWVYCEYTNEVGLRKAMGNKSRRDLLSLLSDLEGDQGEIHAGSARGEGEPDGKAGGVEAQIVTAFHSQTESWRLQGKFRRQGRKREGGIVSIMGRHEVAPVIRRAKLCKEECIALRLYTGPLYILYNALMREYPPHIVHGLAGNKYETTMFVIISGITKLAKHTPIPPGRLLYRGLGGMILPDQFWRPTGQGFLGGVEMGLMSTTADRAVAVQYSGLEQKRAIVLEIQAGRIDVGASLEFISQYAGEAEYLLQPLSCLEVIARPRLDQTDRGEVLVVPVRVNVNLKSVTVEELVERRKILHLAMANNLREELSHEASDNIEAFLAAARLRLSGAAQRILNEDGDAVFHEDSFTVEFEQYCIAGHEHAARDSGKGYFEVAIESREPSSSLSVGLAGSRFALLPLDPADVLAVGSNDASWGMHSLKDPDFSFYGRTHNVNLERDGMPSMWGSDWAEGDVVGVAFDLDSGALWISVNGDFSAPNGVAFEDSLRPSPAAGAGLYPVFAGTHSRVSYNMGTDPARPMRFAPPDPSFLERPAVEPAPCPLDPAGAGIDSESLVMAFDFKVGDHKAVGPDTFNNDLKYKELVNEVLDLKVHLLNKQRAVLLLAAEGATAGQLGACAAAPSQDFNGNTLERECPFRWRDVFGGYLAFKDTVEIPLAVAPCQTALVWEAVLGADRTRRARGADGTRVRLGAEVLALESIRHTLHLAPLRLHYSKYGAAVAGLVTANTSLRDLDLAGHDFGAAIAAALAAAAGRSAFISTVNGQPLEDAADEAERECLRRAVAVGCSLSLRQFDNVGFAGGGEEGKGLDASVRFSAGPRGDALGRLDRAGWAFLLARLRALEWKTLNLRKAFLTAASGAAMAPSLRFLPLIQSLDLGDNALGDAGCAAVAGGLSHLVALRHLDLRDNRLAAPGWRAALGALVRVTSLETLNGLGMDWYRTLSAAAAAGAAAVDVGGRELGADGAEVVCQLALDARPAGAGAAGLTALDMGGVRLGGGGGHALAGRLGGLPGLAELRLGYNGLGFLGASDGVRIAERLPALTALRLLDLEANDLGEEGSAALAAALPVLGALSELHLGYNKAGRRGGEALGAALSALGRLEVLDLDGNKMGLEGCAAVAAGAAGLTALRVLDLQRNDVQVASAGGDSDEAAGLRAILSHLTELDLVLSDGILVDL